MNENRKNRLRHIGITFLSVSGLLLLGGAFLGWSWNAFVSELFGMPQMSFRQALAAEVFIGILSAIVARTIRRPLDGVAHSHRGAPS